MPGAFVLKKSVLELEPKRKSEFEARSAEH